MRIQTIRFVSAVPSLVRSPCSSLVSPRTSKFEGVSSPFFCVPYRITLSLISQALSFSLVSCTCLSPFPPVSLSRVFLPVPCARSPVSPSLPLSLLASRLMKRRSRSQSHSCTRSCHSVTDLSLIHSHSTTSGDLTPNQPNLGNLRIRCQKKRFRFQTFQ